MIVRKVLIIDCRIFGRGVFRPMLPVTRIYLLTSAYEVCKFSKYKSMRAGALKANLGPRHSARSNVQSIDFDTDLLVKSWEEYDNAATHKGRLIRSGSQF